MNRDEILSTIKETVQNGYKYLRYSEYYKKEVEERSTDPEDIPWEKVLPEIQIEVKEQKGGEDQGSEYYVILQVTKDGKTMLVMVSGYYSSYDGTDWSYADVSEVEAYQKTVTDYREVK